MVNRSVWHSFTGDMVMRLIVGEQAFDLIGELVTRKAAEEWARRENVLQSAAEMRKLELPVRSVGVCPVLLLSAVCMAPSASAIALTGEDGATGMAA